MIAGVFSLETLRALYAHMEWADATVWGAALMVADQPIDERLRRLLLHVHNVQRAFLYTWTQQPLSFLEESEFSTLSALHERVQSYYGGVAQFLESLGAARLDEPMVMPWVPEYEAFLGRRFETPTLGETAFQVTSHTTYHRGQVNTRLRELGVEPPLVDFIAWIWLGKPKPDWTRSTPAS